MIKKIIVGYLLFFIIKPSLHCTDNPEKIIVDHNTEIVFGQSGSFSGHFGLYGKLIQHAIRSRFDFINKQGGIHGKKLRLISLDDHGDPEITKHNIKLLYQKYNITMFIGIMGTRGLLSVLPLIQSKKIATFFAWGGDKKLENPTLKTVINSFGLIQPQIVFLAKHIIKKLKIKNIAIFYADDDFSIATKNILVENLVHLGIKPKKVIAYNRFTMAIERSAKTLTAADPRAVICIATHTPIARLINYFFKHGMYGTRFFGIDSAFLVPDILHQKGVDFHYTSSVPNPRTSHLPLANEYKKNSIISSPDDDYNPLSFAYYIYTTLLTKAIQKCHPTAITTEAIIHILEQTNHEQISGLDITFNTTNRYLCPEKIWLI